MAITGQWTLSKDEEWFGEYEYFETKEECIAFGKEYYEGTYFYVGQVEEINMKADGLGDYCIDCIQSHHYDNDGEGAQDYLDDVKYEHIEELDNLIEKVVLDWATRHNYHPTHFSVVNIEKWSEEYGDERYKHIFNSR